MLHNTEKTKSKETKSSRQQGQCKKEKDNPPKCVDWDVDPCLTCHELFYELFHLYNNDLTRFVKECFIHSPEFSPVQYQLELMGNIDNVETGGSLRVAIAGANGIGKTFIGAVISLWGLLCKGHCAVRVSSLTGDNVLGNYFSELRRIVALMRPGLLPYVEQIVHFKSDEACNAIVGTEYNNLKLLTFRDAKGGGGYTLAGTHSKYIICIIDEAGRASPSLFRFVKSWDTKGTCIYLAIGNPLNRGTYFFSLFSNKNWKSMNVSSLDMPHVKDSFKENYEEGTDEYRIHVLGQFPLHADGTLIDQERFHKCIGRRGHGAGRIVMGVDVAGHKSTGDRHAIVIRQGTQIITVDRLQNTQDELRDLIYRMASAYKVNEIYVDSLGVADHLVSHLLTWVPEDLKHVEIQGVRGSEKAFASQIYRNRRAEIYMRLRNWFLANAEIISLPPNILSMDLEEELVATQYTFDTDKKDGYAICPKSDIKAAIQRSPDLADALAYTFGSIMDEPGSTTDAQYIIRQAERADTTCKGVSCRDRIGMTYKSTARTGRTWLQAKTPSDLDRLSQISHSPVLVGISKT
jgi:hypothetical protein